MNFVGWFILCVGMTMTLFGVILDPNLITVFCVVVTSGIFVQAICKVNS